MKTLLERVQAILTGKRINESKTYDGEIPRIHEAIKIIAEELDDTIKKPSFDIESEQEMIVKIIFADGTKKHSRENQIEWLCNNIYIQAVKRLKTWEE